MKRTIESNNPLASGSIGSVAPRKADILVGAVPITDAQWTTLLARVTSCKDNEERLVLLDREKVPYLFTSAQLMALLEVTLSVKTRISMIQHVGPRLIDPRTKATQFVALFRYSEEKEKVEEVLKARTQVLASSLFKPSGLNTAVHGDPARPTPSSSSSSSQSAEPASKPPTPFLGLKGVAGARQKSAVAVSQATKLSTSHSFDVSSSGTTTVGVGSSSSAKSSSSSSSNSRTSKTGNTESSAPVLSRYAPAAASSASAGVCGSVSDEVLGARGGSPVRQPSLYQAAQNSPSSPSLVQLEAAQKTSASIHRLMSTADDAAASKPKTPERPTTVPNSNVFRYVRARLRNDERCAERISLF